MTNSRTETDSFGPLEVQSDRYWGAQTQRSLMNFPIGWEKQPVAIVPLTVNASDAPPLKMARLGCRYRQQSGLSRRRGMCSTTAAL